MFRETTAANSKEVALVYDVGKGVELVARSSTGGTAGRWSATRPPRCPCG